MKYIILIFLMLAMAGCSGGGTIPQELHNAPLPITIVALNDEGVILQDGDGRLWAYGEEYYFVETLIKSDLKPGDTLASLVTD